MVFNGTRAIICLLAVSIVCFSVLYAFSKPSNFFADTITGYLTPNPESLDVPTTQIPPPTANIQSIFLN